MKITNKLIRQFLMRVCINNERVLYNGVLQNWHLAISQTSMLDGFVFNTGNKARGLQREEQYDLTKKCRDLDLIIIMKTKEKSRPKFLILTPLGYKFIDDHKPFSNFLKEDVLGQEAST